MARPSLFLIAGPRGATRSRGPDPAVAEAISRAGVRRPRVAYIGAASGDDPALRFATSDLLKRAGAAAVVLAPLSGKHADTELARQVLMDADLVFVSEGDVDEGMRILRRAHLLRFLKALHRAGKPFFGVSAGSIILARAWVRWRNPGDDASAELFPCLALAPVLCDTHGESEEWEELRTLLMLSPVGALGYGIPSGSALFLDADGRVSSFGGDVVRFRRRSRGVVPVDSLRPD